MWWGETHEVVEDLIPDDARHLETLLACDRVDDHVAVDTDEVLGVKNAVLILVKATILAVFTYQACPVVMSSTQRHCALNPQSRIALS
jgi:hypothetical protein